MKIAFIIRCFSIITLIQSGVTLCGQNIWMHQVTNYQYEEQELENVLQPDKNYILTIYTQESSIALQQMTTFWNRKAELSSLYNAEPIFIENRAKEELSQSFEWASQHFDLKSVFVGDNICQELESCFFPTTLFISQNRIIKAQKTGNTSWEDAVDIMEAFFHATPQKLLSNEMKELIEDREECSDIYVDNRIIYGQYFHNGYSYKWLKSKKDEAEAQIGFLREDGEKLFFMDQAEIEYLMIDFSIHVCDSFYFKDPKSKEAYTFPVRDYYLDHGKKVIELEARIKSCSGEEIYLTFIEGVGTNVGLYYTYKDGYIQQELNCQYRNEELFFTTDEEHNCENRSLSTDDLDSNKIKISNPNNNVLLVSTDERERVLEFQILDLKGIPKTKISKITPSIDISNFEKGAYIIKFFEREKMLESQKFIKL